MLLLGDTGFPTTWNITTSSLRVLHLPSPKAAIVHSRDSFLIRFTIYATPQDLSVVETSDKSM